MSILQGYPQSIKFILTLRCNLRCRMCRSYDRHMDELTTQDIFRIIDLISRSYRFRKKPGIKITGGEPFMRTDILDILDYLTKRGFVISMNTNAVKIEHKWIPRILRTNLRYLRVSLDSPRAEIHDGIRGVKGSFDKSVSFLRALRQKDRKDRTALKILTVIQEANADHLLEMTQLAADLNVALTFIHPMFWPAADGVLGVDDPEGRFWPGEMPGDLYKKVRAFLIREPLAQKSARVSFYPKVRPEELEKYYTNNGGLRRNACGVIDRELRIRPDGGAAVCLLRPGLPVDWRGVRNIKDVFQREDFVRQRKSLVGRELSGECVPCCKAELR